MPALPAAPGVAKVQLGYQVGADVAAMSRFFIHFTGTNPTASQLNTFATSVRTAWSANLAAYMTTVNSLEGVFVEDLSSSSGATGVDVTSVTGTNAGIPIPGGAATMIQFLIARRYRGGKPKIFLPLGNAGNLQSNLQWTAAYLALIQPAYVAFMAAVVGAGWTGAGTVTHVNVSYYNGFTVVTNPITHRARNVPTLRGTPIVEAVTAYSVEAGVASQRRRNVV
jgi:hypothetical protein